MDKQLFPTGQKLCNTHHAPVLEYKCMCEHRISSHILCPSNQQEPTTASESGSSKHSNCPPFDFPKPCKLQRRTSVSKSSTVEKTGLLAGTTWKQHVQAAEGKWSWLTAADNDTAIFIFVFGKGRLSHSTTNHSQLLLSKHSQCNS